MAALATQEKAPHVDETIAELRGLFGDRLSTAAAVREQHGKDISFHEAHLPDAVVFVDASLDAPAPFSFASVAPDDELSVDFSSHHLEPAAVMTLARDLFGAAVPGYVLGIRGYGFDDFGEGLSDRARANLAAAVDFLAGAIRDGHLATAVKAGGSGASWSGG